MLTVFHVWQMTSFHWDLGMFLELGGLENPCIFTRRSGVGGDGAYRGLRKKLAIISPLQLKQKKYVWGTPELLGGGRPLGWHVDNIDDVGRKTRVI